MKNKKENKKLSKSKHPEYLLQYAMKFTKKRLAHCAILYSSIFN